MRYYVIYENPSDYPGKFVLRQMWDIDTPDGASIAAKAIPDAVGDNLETVREALPMGLCHMARHPQDDPVIVETWI